MPLIKMKNTKPFTDDIIWIAFTDVPNRYAYYFRTITWVNSENRYRGNGQKGRFETSEELWKHVEKYIYRKEKEGFVVCTNNREHVPMPPTES